MPRALVAGTGVSGINAAKLLLDCGYEVDIFDENVDRDTSAIREKILGNEGTSEYASKLRVHLGSLGRELAQGAEFLVMSPGINHRAASFIKTLDDAGVPYISELEIAFKYDKGTVIGITGTNGKTTTTSLVGAILQEAKKKTFIVGNIGNAYTSEALKTSEDSYSVVEVAGHQLDTIDAFRPHISAILNITPDHLDRFGTFEEYARTKLKIVMNQTEDDYCVINYDDPLLRSFAEKIPAKVLKYSSKEELEEGAFIRGEEIIIRENGATEVLCKFEDMLILGMHNYENVLAATLITRRLGISFDDIRSCLRKFKAVEHRIEYVDEINGVMYYNDSKGTNPDAAARAVSAMIRPTILIAGGYDKHIEFDDYIKACLGKVRHMVIIGESAKQIAETADKYGFRDYSFADEFVDAVEMCKKIARPGETVLLSPACASWDMFPNYEVRGKLFKELVRK